MIQVGIVGATGYVGSELLRLLYGHPQAKVVAASSQSYAGQPYGAVFESFRHVPLLCQPENLEEMAESCDVVFLALPHGLASGKVTRAILQKTKVIDMGADFRLKDAAVYEEWYGVTHQSKELLPEAVYGLCEINGAAAQTARLVANPGCYTTCSILTLYPLLQDGLIEAEGIVIDAKSGVSGAGRGVNLGVHYCETNENIKPYKVVSHRHTPEIEEQLSYGAGTPVRLVFTPHLAPMNRGILATCYAKPKPGVTKDDIRQSYRKHYGDKPFIRLLLDGQYPETKWVAGSNFCDIGFTLDERTNTLIAVGALDNLVKGAAGQGVQNMNLMFGLPEDEGLAAIPLFPA